MFLHEAWWSSIGSNDDESLPNVITRWSKGPIYLPTVTIWWLAGNAIEIPDQVLSNIINIS